MKKVLLCLVMVIGLLTMTGCSKSNKVIENGNKSIVISNVDKDKRWEAITNYDITLEFNNNKCVSENYRLEFVKESNAIVYGMDMEGKTYIEDYKQEGNVVTYKRTGTNNEFYDNTFDEAYSNAKMLYSTATITKK
jgi:major membrane immunogen (membrane-anchored lipoprotein)